MNWQDLLRVWRFEYFGWHAWRAAEMQRHGCTDQPDLTFYDFLLTRTTRWHLSARGIGRNVEA